jgi:hypothetical protein
LDEILVPVQVNGKEVMFIVDTGATKSIINAEDIRKQIEDGKTNIERTNIQVTVATGEKAEILGTARCEIGISGKTCFTDLLVMPNTLKNALLGMDILSTCEATSKHIKALAESFRKRTVSPTNCRAIEVKTDVLERIKNELLEIEVKNLRELTTTDLLTHKIEVQNVEPIRQKTRSIPFAYQAEFKAMIDDMLTAGIIKESNSPWSSPVRLVKKKDGTLRVTVDYRKLNNVTIKDAYPIPRIDNMLSKLSQARIFTTLDLASGYYQVKMDPESRKYTAFSCDYGFFEYNTMPMGLTNACATFQRLMNKVLEGYIGIFCFVYLDDIIIFSINEEIHFSDVKNIVLRLKENNLKIKTSKCKIAQNRIEYLTHEICDGVISPGKKKTEALFNFKQPKNVKQVQSFLGLGSYYRKFIPNFSTIASPLIKSTEKGKEFRWTEDCQTAFDELRTIVCSERVLILPDFDNEFRLEADASNVGVGAVISQQVKSSWKPIAYFSKHLSKVERNYSTSEKELLAIVLSMEYFKQFLYGRHFEVFTDHEPLKYLLITDDLAPRLSRWMARLRMFDFRVTYRSGKKNGNADALSRIPQEKESDENSSDEENVIINAIHIVDTSIMTDQLNDADIKWMYDLKKNAETEDLYKIRVEKFDNTERKILYKQWERIKISGKNLFREWYDEDDNIRLQMIVPKKHQERLLAQAHSHVLSGHLGFDKTLERLQTRCYWPKLRDSVKKFIENCVECQTTKPPQKYNVTELKPIFASKPFELITTDILGPLAVTANKNKYILVVCDHFTKWVEIFALETQTAREVAENLMLVICRHGVPDSILSDQGKNFQSNLLNELWELLDVHKLRTTPYHPECDGLSERFNRTLKSMITTFVTDDQQGTWDQYLPMLAFAYNTAVHCSTNTTPFEMIYGRQPKLPIDIFCESTTVDLQLTPCDYASHVAKILDRAFKKVRKNTEIKMEKAKIRHDRSVRAANFDVNV